MRSMKSIAIAGICTLLLSACSSQPPESLESVALAADKARLGDTIFAFYLSPQNGKSSAGKPAYVVLVQPDGSYRTIKTLGMDLGQLAWPKEGLYFSDNYQDYLLHDDSLTTVPSPKTEYQQSAFALPDGKGFVAIYNEGLGGARGYSNQVVATEPSASKLYRVEGNYFMNALCGDVVYGIAPQPGAHLTESAHLADKRSKTDPTSEPEMLARLYPAAGDRQEKVIGWRAAFNTGAFNNHLPCEQGVITFLSAYDDADGRPHTAAVSWDTATGAYVEHPLVDDNGQPIPREALDYAAYDSGSLRDGKLEWYKFDGHGHIMATDINTGVTTRRFAIGYGPTNSQSTRVAFTDESVYVLNDPLNTKTPVTFKQFHRSTGEILKSLTLDEISEHLSLELVLRGMAVRPQA